MQETADSLVLAIVGAGRRPLPPLARRSHVAEYRVQGRREGDVLLVTREAVVILSIIRHRGRMSRSAPCFGLLVAALAGNALDGVDQLYLQSTAERASSETCAM